MAHPEAAERQVGALAPAQVPDQRDQRGDRERQLEHQRRQVDALGARHADDDDQHRHHGEVLGDQHADRDPPGLVAQLADVLEDLDPDRGAAEREHEAVEHRALGAPAEQLPEQQHQRDADQDLQRRRADRGAVDVLERAQRQVGPDHEQQHQHAELGEDVDGRAVGDQAEARGPEHRAGDDVADERRLAQAGEQQAARDRADQEQRHRQQIEVLGHRATLLARPCGGLNPGCLDRPPGPLLGRAADRSR